MTPFFDAALNLFFPQWQGSGSLELYEGAKQLHEALCRKIALTQIPVASTYSLTTHQNILGYDQILLQLTHACRIIQAHNPEQILTIGGDCGVEIAPVSFLNQKHSKDLAVIWLDAHGDLNTPTTSPSAHFHGMPLRALLGEGDPGITDRAFSMIYPEQVFLVGARDFDASESVFIQQKQLNLFLSEAINDEAYNQLFACLHKGGFSKLYIHLDLDVLEPNEFPHVLCPTQDGIRLEKLVKLLAALKMRFTVVGLSFLEFLPAMPEKLAILDVIRLVNVFYPGVTARL
ncbi:MAG: arginase family protein [Cyanobacteria bacterium J06626_18]